MNKLLIQYKFIVLRIIKGIFISTDDLGMMIAKYLKRFKEFEIDYSDSVNVDIDYVRLNYLFNLQSMYQLLGFFNVSRLYFRTLTYEKYYIECFNLELINSERMVEIFIDWPCKYNIASFYKNSKKFKDFLFNVKEHNEISIEQLNYKLNTIPKLEINDEFIPNDISFIENQTPFIQIGDFKYLKKINFVDEELQELFIILERSYLKLKEINKTSNIEFKVIYEEIIIQQNMILEKSCFYIFKKLNFTIKDEKNINIKRIIKEMRSFLPLYSKQENYSSENEAILNNILVLYILYNELSNYKIDSLLQYLYTSRNHTLHRYNYLDKNIDNLFYYLELSKDLLYMLNSLKI